MVAGDADALLGLGVEEIEIPVDERAELKYRSARDQEVLALAKGARLPGLRQCLFGRSAGLL